MMNTTFFFVFLVVPAICSDRHVWAGANTRRSRQGAAAKSLPVKAFPLEPCVLAAASTSHRLLACKNKQSSRVVLTYILCYIYVELPCCSMRMTKNPASQKQQWNSLEIDHDDYPRK